MLLPFPVCPASAKHPLSAAVPVALPVPEWVGQSEHGKEEACAVLYLPAMHSKTPLPLPVNPALALQSFKAAEAGLLPVPELLGQFEHAAAPVSVLNVLMRHEVGVPPFGPV